MKNLIKIIPLFVLTLFLASNINAQQSGKSKTNTAIKSNNKPSGTKSNQAKPSQQSKPTHSNSNQPKHVDQNRVESKNVNYKKPQKKVVSVRTLPDKKVIKHKGVNYYYDNHRFYTYAGGRYTVIAPKIGFRIKSLPLGFIKIIHPKRNYFWFEGIFYININNEYEVVEPEIGTIIYELPSDYERVVINGKTYYEFYNVLYEKIQVNGTRAYEVVGFINQ